MSARHTVRVEDVHRMLDHLWKFDPVIAEAIQNETRRQAQTLEMIASENFVSEAVLEAAGSILTNKYAEGYPDKRYYGGCKYVDICEAEAIRRAKELFGAEHANVQPHSGSQANTAVYMSALKLGDTFMGLALNMGGHLTHGHPVNFSGKNYKPVAYGLDKDTEQIDYDEVQRLADEHRPKMILVGASAYPRTLDFARFRHICDSVGATMMVDMAHIAGLIAGGVHPSPVPHADFVTTTTHKTLRGPRSGMILCRSQYAKEVDKNIFPGSQGGPLMHIIAAKAVALKEALAPDFKVYQQNIVKNARKLAEVLKGGGLRLVSGGTDTHLMLVDVSPLGLTGKEAEHVLEEAGITVNKNAIPFDPKPPTVTSGIRIGTPALTTRGMLEPQMEQIGAWIIEVLKHKDDVGKGQSVRQEIEKMASAFPLYADHLTASAATK